MSTIDKRIEAPKILLFLFIVLLAFGIFFRCYNIGKKIYWHDEVFTSVRTAGFNSKEIVLTSFNGQVIKPKQLLQYQTVTSQKTWNDSLVKLIEHPEHPPLYYLLSRAWQKIFGSSILISRSLSVLFGLLILPTIYWLCRELFDSVKVGIWAVGVIAISPIQVLYAQEAREYSLLVLITILTCITLLRAVKDNDRLWWILYAISSTLNFYTSLIAIYIAFSQIVYVLILEKFKFTKIMGNFLKSGVISTILFIPWLWVIKHNFSLLSNNTAWSSQSRPFVELLSYWEFHLSSIFVDLFPKINRDITPRIFGFLVIFVLICSWFTYVKNKPHTYLLLITLAIIPSGIFILSDIINGGIKSINTRYFIPSLLAIQIMVAYWLSPLRNWQDWKRSVSLFIIISLGVSSCWLSSQSDTWWNKGVGKNNARFAEVINSYQKPLVVSNNFNTNVGVIISLTHLLDNKVDLILFYKDSDLPLVDADKYTNVLLYSLREEQRLKFQEKNNCELEQIPVANYSYLWQMKPK